jgi:ABC-type molybdate transport system ATPase subunit
MLSFQRICIRGPRFRSFRISRSWLAPDISLAREPPGRSSILNVLPAKIVATNALNAYEVRYFKIPSGKYPN